VDRETFRQRLKSASESAVQIARKFTFNEICENFVYKIVPNCLDLSSYLTEFEIENLRSRRNELNKTFSAEEVSEKLIIENKVPVWINCSVIRSTRKETTIELLTSRRFRDDSELYHKSENYSPFHSLIQYPPYLQFDSAEKFDVNWRSKKIQTAFKLRKAKIALNAEIKKQKKRKENYWECYDRICESLGNRDKKEIFEKIKSAKALINGLTDGWAEFKIELDLLENSYKSELTKKELVDFEFLQSETKEILKRKKITTP
jgi:hypothetical protein